MKVVIIVLLVVNMFSMLCAEKPNVSVFFKEKKPSQQVLVKVDSLLQNYQDYNIQYFNIEEESTAEVSKGIGLPDTHFPFAVVIDGKFTANIDGEVVSFVHFPTFMHGIGRHEGNWSLENLQIVLENIECLSDNGVLPVLDEFEESSECEE